MHEKNTDRLFGEPGRAGVIGDTGHTRLSRDQLLVMKGFGQLSRRK
jgi:hypothetical protein